MEEKSRRVVSRKRQLLKAVPLTWMFRSGHFLDKRCVIIAGGPSLENFDPKIIQKEFCIGINKAFVRFPSQINYSMDGTFYTEIQEDFKLKRHWDFYHGVKCFLNRDPQWKNDSDIFYVEPLGYKGLSFDLEAGIFPGNNSASGAMFLAIALGFRNIAFLGLDLKVNKDKTHWHDGYGQDPRKLTKKLQNFIECFEEWAEILRLQNIKVYNLNKESALECFKKITLDDWLNENK